MDYTRIICEYAILGRCCIIDSAAKRQKIVPYGGLSGFIRSCFQKLDPGLLLIFMKINRSR